MATSGEFKFLTLGLLLVAVGLTRVATAKYEESALEENDTSPVFIANPRKGYVYLIGSGGPRGHIYFKIGDSLNSNTRLGDWQSVNPKMLTIDSVRVKNSDNCRRQLMDALSRYRSPGRGPESLIANRDQVEELRGLFTRTVNQRCH